MAMTKAFFLQVPPDQRMAFLFEVVDCSSDETLGSPRIGAFAGDTPPNPKNMGGFHKWGTPKMDGF